MDEVTASPRPGSAPPGSRRGEDEHIPRVGEPDLSSGFAMFYRQQLADLVAFVRWLGADVHEAESVSQETMLRAYKAWVTIEHPKAWARAVASREYFRRILACHDDPAADVSDIPCPDADAAMIGQEQADVLALLRRLPLRQRQIMAWVYDGYAPIEIAALLGMEPNAVRGSLHKARETLKAYLAQEGGQS